MKPYPWLLVFSVACWGCVHARDPICRYKVEDPTRDEAIMDLPVILTSSAPTEVDSLADWYRLAENHQLVGRGIDDAIQVFGEDYRISLSHGRREPRVYYRLAGTRSWGIFGVLVLDEDLRVRAITTDPAN